MGKSHDWNIPQYEVTEDLIIRVTRIIHEHVQVNGWSGWLTTIGEIIHEADPASNIEDWYGTFNEALKIARNRGWVNWNSKGPKGRLYQVTLQMGAKFLKDTIPMNLHIATARSSIVIICPHCGTPHEYALAIEMS